ncbi:hypothetical protein [Paenibacillus odorifer]|uniref:hypothetical protein n=1 Tax=Paenibacillus odorifer TaxID=189426 RepID=UPI00117CA152|nr:hypothetical protein [Paenibacillus odorifer]
MRLWGDVGTNLILQARGGNEVDGHGVYCGVRLECGERITVVAWRVGEACYVAAAYNLKTNWSVVAHSA